MEFHFWHFSITGSATSQWNLSTAPYGAAPAHQAQNAKPALRPSLSNPAILLKVQATHSGASSPKIQFRLLWRSLLSTFRTVFVGRMSFLPELKIIIKQGLTKVNGFCMICL